MKWLNNNLSEKQSIYVGATGFSTAISVAIGIVIKAYSNSGLRNAVIDTGLFAVAGFFYGVALSHHTVKRKTTQHSIIEEQMAKVDQKLALIRERRIASWKTKAKPRLAIIANEYVKDKDIITIKRDELDFNSLPSLEDHPLAKHLRCPINHTFMIDPVLAKDGYCYERKALLEWWLGGNTFCPMNPSQELTDPAAMPTCANILVTTWKIYHKEKAKINNQKYQAQLAASENAAANCASMSLL